MRITWHPLTNTQRGAIARFGDIWQTIPHAAPMIIKGKLSSLIHPIGNPDESRWVPLAQITPYESTVLPEPRNRFMAK